jgi:hypothetical protein
VGRYLRRVPPRRLLLRHQSTRHANLRHACAVAFVRLRSYSGAEKPGCPNRPVVARLRAGVESRSTYSVRR